MAAAREAVLIGAVSAMRAVGVPVLTGCARVGLPRSTFYRVSRGYDHYRPVQDPVPHGRRAQPAALSGRERDAVWEVLADPGHAGLSVGQLYWTALDEGRIGCSQSTFYRIARRGRLVGDRRRTRPRIGGGMPVRRKPVVGADKPGALWSWDVTELKGPRTQDRYKLYLAIDVFSRYPVAWRVEYGEDTGKAVQMFRQAFAEHGPPDCLHADNGPPMRAGAMIQALRAAGVLPSFSRPRVSDDNPFSESLFKTIKYDLDCPDRFDDIEHARAWTAEFLHRYAHHHRHSGIGHYTPASVYDGTAEQTRARRQQTLDAYHRQHPERFTRPPQAPPIPQPTGINTKLSQTS